MSGSPLLQSAELLRLGAASTTKVLAFDALRGKQVAIYFSASWCPPCRAFTPKLAAFYAQAQKEAAGGGAFEVVWCSSDDDAQQFKDYSAKMGPWLAVPFENTALRTRLKQEYGVCSAKEQAAVGVKDRKRGIPTLAVIRPDGSVIMLEGDEQVESLGLDALKKWTP